MALFRRLPDDLFRPLSGPNRHVYVEILSSLHKLFFSDSAASIFPSDKTVRTEIEETLISLSLRDWKPEEDDETFPDIPDNAAGHAWRAYRRLVRCGWLEEEQEGYATRVVIPSDVGRLLSALLEISSQRTRLYGGVVQSIYNSIRQVKEQPEEQAAALAEAAHQAHEFFLHLRSLEYGLRDLTKSLKNIHDPKKLLGSFFTDFVEEFLVADYKTLHTQENPFRFRTEILRIVRELRFSTIAKETLPTAYLRLQIVKSLGDALGRVDQDLQVLQRVFEEADNHLARIDTYRSSLERRVAESIRYLDKTQPGAAARLARLTSRLADVDESMLCMLPPLHHMARILPLSPKSPRSPSSTKQPPDPQRLRIRVPNPAHAERLKAIREYQKRRQVDPKRIEEYLERSLANHNEISARNLSIETVDDFIAFAHLRQLKHFAQMGKAGQRLANGYEVRSGNAFQENQWLRFKDFTVIRRR